MHAVVGLFYWFEVELGWQFLPVFSDPLLPLPKGLGKAQVLLYKVPANPVGQLHPWD